MSKELIELVQNLGAPRVLVVGDIMLDRYVFGAAERISQEAPVIVLRADAREARPLAEEQPVHVSSACA